MKRTLLNSDTTGILASGLCMIHCLATPFIFFVKTCSVTCCSDAPVWWKWIDWFFLIVSLCVIFQITKQKGRTWIKYAMWITWVSLLIVIVNEQIGLFFLFDNAIFFPGLALVALHLYNLGSRKRKKQLESLHLTYKK